MQSAIVFIAGSQQPSSDSKKTASSGRGHRIGQVRIYVKIGMMSAEKEARLDKYESDSCPLVLLFILDASERILFLPD